MLDAIHAIGRQVKECRQQDFRANQLVQDRVIRQLETIGEAATRVSSELRPAHPEIPGKDYEEVRRTDG